MPTVLAAPRRVMESEPNPLTGVRLLLRPVLTVCPYAGPGWEYVVVTGVTS